MDTGFKSQNGSGSWKFGWKTEKEKYSTLENDCIFYHIAIGASGIFAATFIQSIGIWYTREMRTKTFIIQILSNVIQRGNGASVLIRLIFS